MRLAPQGPVLVNLCVHPREGQKATGHTCRRGQKGMLVPLSVVPIGDGQASPHRGQILVCRQFGPSLGAAFILFLPLLRACPGAQFSLFFQSWG